MTGPTELEIGSEVRVTGERGQYTVKYIRTEADGGIVVTVFGGDRDPGGRRSMRSFYKDRVRPVGRKRPKVDDEDDR